MPLRDALVVATVSGVTTLNVFLSGALTVAIPSIGVDLHISEADLQWPLTVFSLAYGCTLLLFGRMGDIYGGRILFLAGSAWFAVWSIGTALAPNLTAITLFMAMLGLGAAANTPAGIGIIVAHFPPGARRNTAFGVLGAGQPLGYILGLVLGGLLSQSKATWRAIFYVQAALGALFEEDGGGKLYDKGLDWGGALLSTAGIGLLTYSLAASATAPHGFRTPLIIALLVGSIVLLGVFWAVEVWRENRGKSVLMPPSIWRHPRARMPATIGMVFFAWWNFNTLLYLCALYYQQVHLLSPLQTSLRFLPSIITGVATNLAGGWLMNRVAGLPLILGAVTMNMVAALLFSLMEVNSDFWRISLWVMILLAGADLVYPAGTLQVSSAFDNDSKSLAGGIFTVATRLGASIGMAVTTSITTSVSSTYHASHPNLSPTAPEVLLVGFRAGAWSLFAAAAVSFFIALVGLRGIGIIGSAQEEEEAPKQAEALSDGTFVGGV
ncbi:major facilitator superfamily domain-containing protein [Mycena polygramma]|nr:major facilitator superfamily domain-containing protein [Mycena polygramma]